MFQLQQNMTKRFYPPTSHPPSIIIISSIVLLFFISSPFTFAHAKLSSSLIDIENNDKGLLQEDNNSSWGAVINSNNNRLHSSSSQRFKSLDRILKRLDQGLPSSPQSSSSLSATSSLNSFRNSAVTKRDHPEINQNHHRSNRFTYQSQSQPSMLSSQQRSSATFQSLPRTPASEKEPSPIKLQINSGKLGMGSFNSAKDFDFDENDDDAAETKNDLDHNNNNEKDEDSYEDDDSHEDYKEEPYYDKMARWAYNYKSNYLLQRPTTTTSTTTTTTTTTPPPFSYSQWKWQHLGTRQAVDSYRRQKSALSLTNTPLPANNYQHNNQGKSSFGRTATYGQYYRNVGHNGRIYGGDPFSSGSSSYSSASFSNRFQQQHQNLANEAISHAMKVSREGACRVPKPRIVRVQDFYPHPGKTYVPHCTILHQCSDDTGCCKQDTLTCSPKTTQRVELAFYTIALDNSRPATVERLVFYNHTECECRDKLDEMMPRDSPGSAEISPFQKSTFVSSKALRGNVHEDDASDAWKNCSCPSAFRRRMSSDRSSSNCICDCFDKDKICLNMKRGRDYFSLKDKWCIQSGRCEVPECAYGPYIHLIGRCKRKLENTEQNTAWISYLTT